MGPGGISQPFNLFFFFHGFSSFKKKRLFEPPTFTDFRISLVSVTSLCYKNFILVLPLDHRPRIKRTSCKIFINSFTDKLLWLIEVLAQKDLQKRKNGLLLLQLQRGLLDLSWYLECLDSKQQLIIPLHSHTLVKQGLMHLFYKFSILSC